MSNSESPFTLVSSSMGDVCSNRKGGLLRLIQSDVFDPLMALSYLWRYNGAEAGIQFMICEQVKKMGSFAIQSILPQLCHLVVCNGNELVSVENLLLQSCSSSLHSAVLVKDLRKQRLNFCVDALVFGELLDFQPLLNATILSVHYTRTVRILSDIQCAVFQHRHYNIENGSSSSSTNSIRAGIIAAGCSLAGITVHEILPSMRPMIMTEARVNLRSKSHRPGRIHTNLAVSPHPFDSVTTTTTSLNNPHMSADQTMEDLYSGTAFALKSYIMKAAKHVQNTVNSPTTTTSTQLKEVSLYYHAEMHFVMSLVDIASRLVSVGREGRGNALKAELALINHNLPASLCIPLWCSGDDSIVKGVKEDLAVKDVDNMSSKDTHHHRILRISPSDAAVLNSAERAPFLLQIEVLESSDLTDDEFTDLINSIKSTTRTSISVSRVNSEPELPAYEETNSDSTDINTVNIIPLASTYEEFCSSDSEYLTESGFSERMRTAAIMLAQLAKQAHQPGVTTQKITEIAAIKARIIREMEALEKNRLFDALQHANSSNDEDFSDKTMVRMDVDKEDPSAAIFQESSDDKANRIRLESPYGHLPGWKLVSVIVKSCPDIRQEQLACQLIAEMAKIWSDANLPLWTYCFRVLVASSNGGLIETVPDAISIHSIKKSAYFKKNTSNPAFIFSLRDHFIRSFGSPDSDTFIEARDGFINSLAAYSLITYLLHVKDRHDGNILLDSKGHVIHIDFGFMLSNSPGYVGFESAPFKLSPEYIELLGGLHSPAFARFKDAIFHGLIEIRKHADRLLILLEVMQKDSRLPCFYSRDAVALMRMRLHLTLTDVQLRQVVDRLVISSAFNVFTKLYDTYQYYSNGIL